MPLVMSCFLNLPREKQLEPSSLSNIAPLAIYLLGKNPFPPYPFALPFVALSPIILVGWAVSSAGERLLDEEKVVGSTPTPPTIFHLSASIPYDIKGKTSKSD